MTNCKQVLTSALLFTVLFGANLGVSTVARATEADSDLVQAAFDDREVGAEIRAFEQRLHGRYSSSEQISDGFSKLLNPQRVLQSYLVALKVRSSDGRTIRSVFARISKSNGAITRVALVRLADAE
jgi:hypothetical protein